MIESSSYSASTTSPMKSTPRNACTTSTTSSASQSLHSGLFTHGDDPQTFLSEGNKHFIYKRFLAAIAEYTAGLQHFELLKVEQADHCDENVENGPRKKDGSTQLNKFSSSVFFELLSNRALTYLTIGNHAAALQDTQHLLQHSPSHFKGVIRHAKALAGLRRYEDAIKFLNNCVKQFVGQEKRSQKAESIRELTSFVETLKRMKHQSETGDFYDVPQIMDKPYQPSPVDWVDYVGAVKVVNVEGKGRGIVAAQDLPAGKLVCASRAFEVIFLGEDSNPEEGISEESKEALESGQFKVEDDRTLNLLARKIYDRLIQNPEKRAEFYQLHAGNDLGHLEPLSSNDGSVHPVDMARIYGICRTNTFANSGDSYPEVEMSVGLWVFPAYVNHICIGGNCTWKIFSDFLFIRTFRPVKKGEELLVSYVSPAFPFKARTEVLTKRLGFICSCVLCELDRAVPQSAQDEKDRLKMLVQNTEVKFAQLDPTEGSREEYAKKVETSIMLLEQIIAKLEKIQPKHGTYNASLLDPLQKLGLKYFGVGEFQKMTKVMERACNLMKSCMLPHGVVDCSLWIIAAYMQTGNAKLAKKWGKVLRDNLILAYGDLQVLRVLGSWVIEPMTKWGLYTK